MTATMFLSAAYSLALAVTTSGSHLPRAAEASSLASYSIVHWPLQALPPFSSRAILMAFTMVCVWPSEEPVIGRSDTILTLPPCAAPPQAASARLAITSSENRADVLLDIFVLSSRESRQDRSTRFTRYR